MIRTALVLLPFLSVPAYGQTIPIVSAVPQNDGTSMEDDIR